MTRTTNPANPYAPPTAAVADIETFETSPPLWNPGAAARWSLLFSPAFGALLHMKNWRAMGEPERAATSKRWAIGSAVAVVVLVVLSLVLPKVGDGLRRIGGLVLLLSWYYGIGKAQSTSVAARYGKTYPRRGWAKPLLLGLLTCIGFIAALVVVVLTASRLGG